MAWAGADFGSLGPTFRGVVWEGREDQGRRGCAPTKQIMNSTQKIPWRIESENTYR